MLALVRMSPLGQIATTTYRLSAAGEGDLLGVAWSTVARWEGGSRPDAKMATKLARLGRALDALGDLIVPEDRLLFFEQHHPLLLKMRPIDLLDTEQGTAAVMHLVEGLESGAFA